MVALACPSIVWTTFTSAPDAIASDAAVCRRPCGVSPVSPVASTAGMNTERRKWLSRSTEPFAPVKTNVIGERRAPRHLDQLLSTFAFCAANSASVMTPWSRRAASFVSSSAVLVDVPAADWM